MKIIKEEKGFALPLTLVIVLALSILGTTLFFISMTETRQVVMTEEKMKAQYIARSGAHAVAAYLIENPDESSELINSETSQLVSFGGGEFEIEVEGSPEDLIYVKSTGFYGDSKQNIVVTIKDAHEAPLIFKEGSFPGQSGSAEIKDGDVYYTISYDMNEDIVKDGELIKLERDFDPVILPCKPCNSCESCTSENGKCSKQLFEYCPGPISEYNAGDVISESIGYGDGTNYGNITVRGNDKLIIEPNNDEMIIKADKIDLGNNDMIVDLSNVNNNPKTVVIVADKFEKAKSIKVEGSGYLVFYVREFIAGGNFDFDPNEVTINIFILEGGIFRLSGSPNFTGAIYAPDATVDLDGGGNTASSLNGWIIADNFNGGANTSLNFKNIELIEDMVDLRFYRIEKWNYN